MATTKEWNCYGATWLLIMAGFFIRLFLGSQFLLVPDEANYWQWSRYLALGYHDHPPLLAWSIWLSTHIFGQNEFAVRLPAILGLTIASGYIALLAGRWFTWRCAFHTTLLSQGILLFNGTALIATPDAMLLPCWAGACYHTGRALERGKMGQWLLAGSCFGLGLLAKYTMVLFLPSLLCYALFSNRYRRRLFTAGPWLGLVFGALFFTPVLIWNSQHEWATFRHVLYMGGVNDTNFVTLKYLGEFLGSQLGLLSPPVLLMIWYAWFKGSSNKRLRSDDAQYLLWTSLTTFVVFLLLSLHSRVYGNWPAAGYLTAIILIAVCYSPGQLGYNSTSRHLPWKISVIVAYLLCVPVLIQLLYPIMPLPVALDRTARETKGWHELARAVAQRLDGMPQPEQCFVFGLRYQIASELAFYLPGQPRTVSINRWNRPNVYDYWFEDKMVIGRDGVGVSTHKDSGDNLLEVFARVDPPEEVKIYRTSPWFGEELVNTFYVYKAYGFKGGLRWQPPESGDIRAKMK